MECITCGGKTKGFKCDVCAKESPVVDINHGCGSAHFVRKCIGCRRAETLCEC